MGDDFLLGVEPPLPQVQGSPVRLASASSSPSVKMKVWKEKRALVQAAPCPCPGRPPQGSGNAASGAPAPHPAQAPCAQSGPRAQPEWKQGWGFCRPHPPCRQLGPRSPGSCAGTSQVGRPAHPPGNRLQARPAHLAGHTPLLTQPGVGAEGGRGTGIGGRLWEAKSQSAEDKGLCWAAAKPQRTKGRREDESPGIVRQLCPRPRSGGAGPALTRPVLSGSGLAAHYHTAGLVNWAGLGARSRGQGCSRGMPSIGLGPQASTPGCVARGQVTSSEPKQPPLFSGDADGP